MQILPQAICTSCGLVAGLDIGKRTCCTSKESRTETFVDSHDNEKHPIKLPITQMSRIDVGPHKNVPQGSFIQPAQSRTCEGCHTQIRLEATCAKGILNSLGSRSIWRTTALVLRLRLWLLNFLKEMTP